MGWQWHQLDHMQIICTSLQTDNHARTSPLSFYRPYALPAAQPTASKQSTECIYCIVTGKLMLNLCESRRPYTLPEPHHTYTTNVLWSFFRDHPGEPVPEENFWTLWCKGRLTDADKPTIQMGATPSGLVTSAHLQHPPIFFTGQMPFLPPNQQHQSTKGN